MLWLSEVTIKSINRINYPTIQQFLFWFIQSAFNWLNIPSLSFKCQFCRNHHLALSENRLIHSKPLIIPSSFIIIFPTKIALSMPLGFRGRKNSWFSLVDALPNRWQRSSIQWLPSGNQTWRES